MMFVHASLGHLGSYKCYAEIKDTFHFRNLGRKLRNFIAVCDLCQRSKHMNRAYDVTEKVSFRNVQENCVLSINMEVYQHRGETSNTFL